MSPVRIAIGSDEKTALTDAVKAWLREQGHEVVAFGALRDGEREVDWPLVGAAVGRAVADATVDQGVVCCWTGTGVSMAANKVPGVRAALCSDAETARGARIYNHANVLVLSLRATSEAVAREVLQAWFSTSLSDDAWNREQIGRIADLDRARSEPSGKV